MKLQYEAIEMFLKCSYYLKNKFNFVVERKRLKSHNFKRLKISYDTLPYSLHFPTGDEPSFCPATPCFRDMVSSSRARALHTQDEWFQRNTQNIAAQVDDRYFISTTCHVPAAHRSSCVMREEFAGASPKPIDII